jgi:hypothetical protein
MRTLSFFSSSFLSLMAGIEVPIVLSLLTLGKLCTYFV